ncbi:MAG: sigma-70 family RNA polymerase sigma factor [Clostridia bacterium]|nr:sigma-70 family RNA polymerase sigma factor [Clostridia bacterium]
MEEFERLCHEEYQTVRLFLVRLCGDAALAEELTQETFYQAMRGWKKFRGQCAASTWLCGIAKRQFFQYCRKPRPLPVADVPDTPGETVEDHLLRKETRLEAHRLLHDLPEPYKEVLTLRTFGELTHEEIGALFGKTAAWARVTYYRGRQMLAAMLEGDDTHA